MTTSGLVTPPRPTPQRLTPPEPRVSARPRVVMPARPSFGRVLRWSLLLSLLVHALFLLLSPIFIQMDRPPGGAAVAAVEVPRATGLEMLIVIASENAPDDPLPQEVPTEVPSVFQPPDAPLPPGAAAPTPAGAPPEAAPPGRSQRDVLQPGYRDPRLYVAPNILPNIHKTDHERYMEHLQARIDAVNDSMGIAARRNAQTSDWTVTDGSGNRWGLSPEGLHLGGITIPPQLVPRPRATGDNASIEEGRERQRQRDEIQRQEDDRERQRIRDERTEAIRERNRAAEN